MATTPENKVKNQVRATLDKYAHLGLWYFFVPQNGYGRSGVPDIVGCFRGYFFAIECKAGDNQPTALQEKEMNGIHRAGGRAIVVNEKNLDRLEGMLMTLAGE